MFGTDNNSAAKPSERGMRIGCQQYNFRFLAYRMALGLDDVIRGGDTALLRLGEPASPVPESVSALLLEHIANRDNMNNATNPASGRLVPSRRTG
ncbi:hypothetical protein ACIO02_07240 [Streptomyces sp. NPDC087568]|uniref:hypothetical protein n=1 Tax=Streptomyces sp. NPDC087568 TaxID=3365799 RepID=UPI0038085F2F